MKSAARRRICPRRSLLSRNATPSVFEASTRIESSRVWSMALSAISDTPSLMSVSIAGRPRGSIG